MAISTTSSPIRLFPSHNNVSMSPPSNLFIGSTGSTNFGFISCNTRVRSMVSGSCCTQTLLTDSPMANSSEVPTIVDVDLGSRSYPIYIGSGLLDQPHLLQRHVHGKKALVVTNTTVAPLYLDKVIDALTRDNPNISVEAVILPDGEQHKHMLLVFCVVSISFKFRQLSTLPDRELISRIAEVIKCGLVRDADFFDWQEKNMAALLSRDTTALTYAIKRSCEIKAEVVSLDEREQGLRLTLNFGHTFGHAIETASGFGQWLHGEGVAVGIVMAVDLSYRLGWIDESLVKRVDTILKEARLPVAPPESMTVDMFKSLMAVDKKVADGVMRLVLLKGPLGNSVFTGDYDRAALDQTLQAFCKT